MYAKDKSDIHPAKWSRDELHRAISAEQYQPMTRLHFNLFAKLCHAVAYTSGWWHDPATGEPLDRNEGELICLMHSELSEAMEGVRKDRMDDHLTHRKMAEVELADTMIRIFDYADACGYDLGKTIIEKLLYNMERADHKPENRTQAGGKRF